VDKIYPDLCGSLSVAQADLLDMDLPALSGARYDSGFGAYTPAQQMMMVQAATVGHVVMNGVLRLISLLGVMRSFC
jgi:hypothetical protein